MKLDTLAVHAGDRKKPGEYIPATTPIYGASSYYYEHVEDLDRGLQGRGRRPRLLALRQPDHRCAGRVGGDTRRRRPGRGDVLRHGRAAFGSAGRHHRPPQVDCRGERALRTDVHAADERARARRRRREFCRPLRLGGLRGRGRRGEARLRVGGNHVEPAVAGAPRSTRSPRSPTATAHCWLSTPPSRRPC